jgi:hypothetical protein
MAKRSKESRQRSREASTVHGLSRDSEGRRSKILGVWNQMTQRCGNPKHADYKNYGGRGIKVCARWLTFYNFACDMSPKPEGLSLERKDNNKGYSPGNCCWATKKRQSRNRRNNRVVTFAGKTQCLSAWAEDLGMAYKTLQHRIDNLGWSLEKTLTTLSRGHRISL